MSLLHTKRAEPCVLATQSRLAIVLRIVLSKVALLNVHNESMIVEFPTNREYIGREFSPFLIYFTTSSLDIKKKTPITTFSTGRDFTMHHIVAIFFRTGRVL